MITEDGSDVFALILLVTVLNTFSPLGGIHAHNLRHVHLGALQGMAFTMHAPFTFPWV